MIGVRIDGIHYTCESVYIESSETITGLSMVDGMFTDITLENVRTINGEELPVRGGSKQIGVRSNLIDINTKEPA